MSESPGWVALVLVALIGVWFVLYILPLSYWRAQSVHYWARFRWRTGAWCTHPHLTEWRHLSAGGERRTCERCGVEWRRGHRWLARRRRRRECFHHDRPAWAKGEVDSRSYIREQLIDMGRRKLYECETRAGGCGRLWFHP